MSPDPLVSLSVLINESTTSNFFSTLPPAVPTERPIGCPIGAWEPLNHVLFQLANAALLVSYLAPNGIYGILFLHSWLVIGFLFFSIWAWVVICAPDVFAWNFAFMIINTIQMLFILYRLRPVKFSAELEDVYNSLFQPLHIPRYLFKKLVNPEYSTLLTLHQGEPYATQNATKCDRLGLIISGSVNVLCNMQFLHHIQDKQFLDSPEFESTTNGEEKFQVSIIAGMPVRVIYWQRSALEYLFVKEPYLAHVMGTIIARDITNKLYALNDKVKMFKGSRLDIRLPSITATAFTHRPESTTSSNLARSPKLDLKDMVEEEDSDMEEDVFADEKDNMISNGEVQKRNKGKKGLKGAKGSPRSPGTPKGPGSPGSPSSNKSGPKSPK